MTPIRVIKIGGSLLQRAGLLADLQSWQSSLAEPMINVWIVGGGAAVDEIRDRDRRQSPLGTIGQRRDGYSMGENGNSAEASSSWSHQTSGRCPKVPRILANPATPKSLTALPIGPLDSTAHWASIKAMDANAVVLAGRLPDWKATDALEDILRSADRPIHGTSVLKQAPQATLPSGQNGPKDQIHPPTRNWILKTHRWIKAADSQLDPQHQLPHSWDVTSDSIAAWVAIRIRSTQLILLKSCDVPTATIPELARRGIVDSYLPTLLLQRHDFQFTCEHLPITGGSHHEKITSNH